MTIGQAVVLGQFPKNKMVFTETLIPGTYKIDLERKGDDRGFFARLFCKNEYAKYNLNSDVVQMNTSFTADRGTFRGLHYQLPPKAEDKVVKVLKGGMFDITLDLRPKSPTFGKYYTTELNDKNKTMMYIPKGCAHGFLILEDNTELIYMVTEFYSPENERVIRWNDPKFKIKLPYDPVIVSEKDSLAKDFDEQTHLNSDMYLI